MRRIINLSLVSTQFQLRNAFEVSNKYLNANMSFMLFILTSNHEMQMQSIIKDRKLNLVGKIHMRFLFQYIDLFFKILLLRINCKIDTLIIGHSQNRLMKFCAIFLKFKKLIFVDDGEILEIKNSKTALNFYKKNFPIDFYTIFDLKPTKSINFIKYEYEIFNCRLKKPLNNSICIFIGSCYVETNLISKKNYISLLKKILEKEKKLIYICHPREDIEKFGDISAIKVIKSQYGIEDYYNSLDYFPSKTIGIYSTAYFSLKKHFPQISDSLFMIDLRKYYKISSKLNNEYDYALNYIKEYVI